MSHACTPILVGGALSVSEIFLLSKTAKFPFLIMDYYSPWSAKNLIYWNQIKKFMQVGIDVTCMHTNFGGWSPFGFGDFSTFKNAKFPFPTIDYSLWSSENLIDRNQLKKSMQVGIDVTCMHTNFGGCDCGLSGFGDMYRKICMSYW